jgi:hypothetical protein
MQIPRSARDDMFGRVGDTEIGNGSRGKEARGKGAASGKRCALFCTQCFRTGLGLCRAHGAFLAWRDWRRRSEGAGGRPFIFQDKPAVRETESKELGRVE